MGAKTVVLVACLTVEKFKIRRPFKNGEMRGSGKSQDAQCIAQMRGLAFFADEADRHFSTACREVARRWSGKAINRSRAAFAANCDVLNWSDVTVLYACESGSRAWGFESVDSDYDVRFIYVRKTPWYLSVQRKRDVIEKPIDDELDISGWDVTKALQLLRRSNPPLLEWLQSPVVYVRKSSFAERMRRLMGEYYSPISCMYHYLHMAKNNYRRYLREEIVWTKKYFYVLRPILACIWIERGFGVVPMEFAKLVERVVESDELRREIDELLIMKRAGAELRRGPLNPVLSGFIEQELVRLNGRLQPPSRSKDHAPLDRLFVETLREVNGEGIGPCVQVDDS